MGKATCASMGLMVHFLGLPRLGPKLLASIRGPIRDGTEGGKTKVKLGGVHEPHHKRLAPWAQTQNALGSHNGCLTTTLAKQQVPLSENPECPDPDRDPCLIRGCAAHDGTLGGKARGQLRSGLALKPNMEQTRFRPTRKQGPQTCVHCSLWRATRVSSDTQEFYNNPHEPLKAKLALGALPFTHKPTVMRHLYFRRLSRDLRHESGLRAMPPVAILRRVVPIHLDRG